jgi:peptide/nickel transport system permease protein
MYGGYKTGTIPTMTLSFIWDVVWHSILPGLSIILVSTGGWALGMRSLMVMTQGEDYVIFADAMGLRDRTIFSQYAIRNALLPQVTALALALGTIVSGAVLVEVIFGYPGIGTMLYQAIRGSDYYLVQGIVFVVIVSIGLATFVLDIIYPLLDPRITYRKG